MSNVTVSREQGYWRAKCNDRSTCAAYTAAGKVGAFWRGPHRSSRHLAHADAIQHLAERHELPLICSQLTCSKRAVGVVQRQGHTLLRCLDHHVDLRGGA